MNMKISQFRIIVENELRTNSSSEFQMKMNTAWIKTFISYPEGIKSCTNWSDFGQNWTKFVGGIAKKQFYIYLNLEDRHINGK